MKYANAGLLGLGLLLFGAVLSEVDLDTLGSQISRVGWSGAAAIISVYALGFSVDVLSWQVVLRSAVMNTFWFRRLFLIRMVGEAYNNLTPASLAGEAVKVWLLKHHHDVTYADSSTSLMISKTASMTSLTAFAGAALITALLVLDLTVEQKLYSTTLFIVLLSSISVFVLLQRAGFLGAVADQASPARVGRRLASIAKNLQRFDFGVQAFYSQEKRLFGLSFALAMLGWLLGVVEIFVIFRVLDYPISWTAALLIEAALQLVRTLVFVVPAGLGAQEAAMFVVAGSIISDPGAGIAAALVRRCRELAWIAASMSIGVKYSVPTARLKEEVG